MVERTALATEITSTRGVISQDLTIEKLKLKRKPDDIQDIVARQGPFQGKGAFGRVYKGHIIKRTKEEIAMKIIPRSEDGKEDQYNLIEIEIMSQIDNPFINKLMYYYFQKDESSNQEELVLLQPLAMSDLNQFLDDKYPKGGMRENQAIEFFAQLAIGINAIHEKKVIHRDLNPWNILVFKNDKKSILNDNQEFILKITDFGCSKILQPHEYKALSKVGKIGYFAPEQVNNSGQGYNSSVDIFALGLTVFKMLTGEVPNAGDISKRSIKVDYCSSEFIELLYQLCSLDSKDRPTIDQIIKNPIVQKSSTYKSYMRDYVLPIDKSKIETATMTEFDQDIAQITEFEIEIKPLNKLQTETSTLFGSQDLQQKLELQQMNFVDHQQKFKADQKKYEADLQQKLQDQNFEIKLLQNYQDDLQQKFPPQIMEQRLKIPLKNSLPEIGRVLYQMDRVRQVFKANESEWPAQFEFAIGNNDEQYFIDKYSSSQQNQSIDQLRILRLCQFKRQVEANGNIFVGLYNEGSRFYGRYYQKDRIIEGHLANGWFHGESQYGINAQGDNCYYDGEYVDGSAYRYGVMIMSDGDMYCGEYKNGKRHGLGTYYQSNGNSYEGQWMNGYKHGEGVMKYANGDIEVGTWKDNKKHGEFIYTFASGKQEKIKYEMNKEISRQVIKST
eukprot:403339778